MLCAAQLLSAMVAKLGNMDDPLPQDSFEGVDEDEWVSRCERSSRADEARLQQSAKTSNKFVLKNV